MFSIEVRKTFDKAIENIWNNLGNDLIETMAASFQGFGVGLTLFPFEVHLLLT